MVLQVLSTNGKLMIDDYGNFEGVKKAADEVLGRININVIDGKLAVYVKY